MTLRIGGVPEHFNLPFRVAARCGYWTARGLDVHWAEQSGGTGQMLARLENGSLDAAAILTEGIVTAIARGLPARIVAQYIDSPLPWGLHVAASSRFERPRQLATARFAMTRPGSGSHLMAYVLADRLGFSLRPDQFVEVGTLDGARRALARGRADVLMWDHFMLAGLVQAGELRRIGVQPTPWPSFVIAARRGATLSRVRQAARAIAELAASLKASGELGRLAVDLYGVLPDQVAAWERGVRWTAGPLPAATVVDVQRQLRDVGLLPRTYAPSRFLA